MRIGELKERLFGALLLHSQRNGFKEYDLNVVAAEYGLPLASRQGALLGREMLREGYVERPHGLLDSPFEEPVEFRLTYKGIEAAEDVLEDYPDLAGRIPAAGRYVTVGDNQRSEIEGDLGQLLEVVHTTNDVDDESRQIALSEIAIFETTISRPRLATDLVQRFIDFVLKRIQHTFSAAIVQEVAQRLVQALLKLIS